MQAYEDNKEQIQALLDRLNYLYWRSQELQLQTATLEEQIHQINQQIQKTLSELLRQTAQLNEQLQKAAVAQAPRYRTDDKTSEDRKN